MQTPNTDALAGKRVCLPHQIVGGFPAIKFPKISGIPARKCRRLIEVHAYVMYDGQQKFKR